MPLLVWNESYIAVTKLPPERNFDMFSLPDVIRYSLRDVFNRLEALGSSRRQKVEFYTRIFADVKSLKVGSKLKFETN